jgi:hypothetical protein
VLPVLLPAFHTLSAPGPLQLRASSWRVTDWYAVTAAVATTSARMTLSLVVTSSLAVHPHEAHWPALPLTRSEDPLNDIVRLWCVMRM